MVDGEMHKVKDEVTRVKDIVGEKNEGSCADIDAQCAQYQSYLRWGNLSNECHFSRQ